MVQFHREAKRSGGGIGCPRMNVGKSKTSGAAENNSRQTNGHRSAPSIHMSSSKKTVAASLEALSRLRNRKVRNSQEVFDHADFLLQKGVNVQSKMGDEYWAFLEQLAFAAIDLGKEDVADDCLTQLNERFPDSPRVQMLYGMQVEATGKLSEALKLYDSILAVDDANAGIWRRRVAVYKQMGDRRRAVEDLCAYLDAFYTDTEGWLELTDLYSAQYQYTSAMQALSHAMLLAPQNPFYVLQFAETAASAGAWALALKMYLRCVEMDEGGCARRAWFGIKNAAKHILAGEVGTTSDEVKPPSENTVRELSVLATERLVATSGVDRVVSSWLAV